LHAGVRLSLVVCFVLEALTRMIMATTTSLPLLYVMLYTLLPASGALGVPVRIPCLLLSRTCTSPSTHEGLGLELRLFT
jgi:hypothetical protein